MPVLNQEILINPELSHPCKSKVIYLCIFENHNFRKEPAVRKAGFAECSLDLRALVNHSLDSLIHVDTLYRVPLNIQDPI